MASPGLTDQLTRKPWSLDADIIQQHCMQQYLTPGCGNFYGKKST